MTRSRKLLFILCTALFLSGCSGQSKDADKISKLEKQLADAKQRAEKAEQAEQEALEKLKEYEDASEDVSEPEGGSSEAAEDVPDAQVQGETASRPQTIVLDPGHSAVVAQGTEPLGPGSSEYKSADTGGTSGVSTGVPEYELTLNISLQLKQELENRGYTVLMTRESSDIPLSCVQRADVANNANADAYVRIHANGSENQSATGAMTICTTPQSPYVPEMYSANRLLSDCILNKLCEATGCRKERVWETDTMSGNNWSKVPVTIVEMGYMSNPQEDMMMQSPEYQSQIVQGIANGIDTYLGY